MIDLALTFLKNHLNEHLSLHAAQAAEDKVRFITNNGTGSAMIQEGAISMALINTEEDRTMRPADPFSRPGADGAQRGQPHVFLNLHVLFVSCFREYEQTLLYLSRVIQFFQANRVLTPQSAPALAAHVQQLVMELRSMSMQELNDVWNMLKTGAHPCALYKVKMIVFQGDDAVALPRVQEVERRVTP